MQLIWYWIAPQGKMTCAIVCQLCSNCAWEHFGARCGSLMFTEGSGSLIYRIFFYKWVHPLKIGMVVVLTRISHGAQSGFKEKLSPFLISNIPHTTPLWHYPKECCIRMKSLVKSVELLSNNVSVFTMTTITEQVVTKRLHSPNSCYQLAVGKGPDLSKRTFLKLKSVFIQQILMSMSWALKL